MLRTNLPDVITNVLELVESYQININLTENQKSK
jgi:hypothetical protein